MPPLLLIHFYVEHETDLLGEGLREDFLFVVLEVLGDLDGLLLFLLRLSLQDQEIQDDQTIKIINSGAG